MEGGDHRLIERLRPMASFNYVFRPSSRATTARKSFRGERRPLSSAVGTGRAYAAYLGDERLLHRV
jgi:hypothetical protein